MARLKQLLTLFLILAVAIASAPDTSAQKSRTKSKSTTTQSGSKASKKAPTGKKGNTGKASTTGKKSTSGKNSGKQSTLRRGSKQTPPKNESSADAKRRERETQQEIARTKEQIRLNEQQVKRGLKELGKLQADISAGEKVVTQTGLEVSQLDANIANLEKEISDNELQLSSMRAEYLKAIKKVRAHKNSASDLAFIFGAKDFQQALDRMRYLKRISKWRSQRSEEISAKVKTLSHDKKLLAQNREQKDKTLQVQLSAQNQLKTQYAKQDAVVAGLKKNGSALKTHLAKKQAEANALKSRIAALIAEENRKAEAARKAEEARKEEAARKAEAAKKANKERPDNNADKNNRQNIAKKNESGNAPAQTSKSKGETIAKNAPVRKPGAGSDFAAMKGALPRPVNGAFKITSRFGKHALPDLPDVVYDNPGIDAQTAAGASVLAVYAGKVSGVYLLPGFSTVVIVNHGNYYTVYANIASASVKVGQEVKQGTALGALAADEDNPGHSSIHFEVWHNREKLNPEGWIR